MRAARAFTLRGARRGALGSALLALLALLIGLVAAIAPVGPAGADDEAAPFAGAAPLYLVTLQGPGAAGAAVFLPPALLERRMLAEQDALLAAVGAPEPVYRWTTALNGFAVQLSPEQADRIAGRPGVAVVERNTVRPLAAASTNDARAALTDRTGRTGRAGGLGIAGPRRGGAGVVIGVVDTGIAPESPLFARIRHDGSSSFRGGCEPGQSWSAADCNGKIAGARWFVDGFGAAAVRATTSLSARDDDGHGTQMASIAAGNAGVPVRVGDERLGRYGGMAPQAQLAVYKACWSAPDPDDDGCATADLVTAVDRATRDGVDVLSLSVAGPSSIDTLERALLGAAEADVVVAAAAGNQGDRADAAHPSPWVTTVGGTTGETRRGSVVLGGRRSLTGAMLSHREVGPRRVVLGSQVPAEGARPTEARQCAPGSLDAGRVEGAVVVCARGGGVGRVDKSQAVALADGAGMVLVNVRPDSIDTDVHRVPTVHLGVGPGRGLVRWVRDHPAGRISLAPLGVVDRRARVAAWSSGGSADAGIVKPDLLAPASAVLGAVPAGPGRDGGQTWDVVSGTSAATAYTSGAAATLLGRRGWSAVLVRSALVTTATPLPSSPVLRAGAGRLRLPEAGRPGLAHVVDARDYRDWLEGRLTELNTPSLLLSGATTTAERTVTNLGTRRTYFSSGTVGLRGDVQVTPAAIRLGPGESATYTVTVDQRRGGRVDDGYVVWRGARGTVTRIPVVVAR